MKLKGWKTIQKRRNWRFPVVNKNNYSREQARLSLLSYNLLIWNKGEDESLKLPALKHSQGEGSFIQVWLQWKGDYWAVLNPSEITKLMTFQNTTNQFCCPSLLTKWAPQTSTRRQQSSKNCSSSAWTVTKILSQISESHLVSPRGILGKSRLLSDLK